MKSKFVRVRLDVPFREQPAVRKLLHPAADGPISPELCYRLLSIADQIIRKELSQYGGAYTLEGLRIGYWYAKEGKITPSSPAYTYQWGEVPPADLPEDDADEEEEKLRDPKLNPLSFAFIERLVLRIREEMLANTDVPKECIHVFLSGKHTNAFFGEDCCLIKQRRRVYIDHQTKCTGRICGQW